MMIPLAILAAVLAAPFAYAIRTAIAGRAPDGRLVREGGTPLLGLWVMEAYYWVVRSTGEALVRSGLSPDTFTLISLAIAATTLPLAATGRFAEAGAAVIVSGMFDGIDGLVARGRGIGSDAGEVLDAIVDRYADALPWLGIAIHYRTSAWQMALPIAALIGSMMVSYARSKAESMSIQLKPGLMRRHERIAYLTGGLVFAPLVGTGLGARWNIDQPLTLLVSGFVGVMANVTTIGLVRQTRARLIADGRGPQGSKA